VYVSGKGGNFPLLKWRVCTLGCVCVCVCKRGGGGTSPSLNSPTENGIAFKLFCIKYMLWVSRQ
jgi:hypothetical protein